RYTLNTKRWDDHWFGSRRGSNIFIEALFGIAHGFDSFFPASSGVESSANSFSFQVGGGINMSLTKHLGLRALEADYVRTALPNGADNTQNDLRLAFGITYRLSK